MVGLPFVATVAVRLGVDDVKARLAREVFQILEPESM
jgi:hypothetical protein